MELLQLFSLPLINGVAHAIKIWLCCKNTTNAAIKFTAIATRKHSLQKPATIISPHQIISKTDYTRNSCRSS